jgi:hypothetical protein
MDNLTKAETIIEQILPKFFTFRLWQTEHLEDGSLNKTYTEKGDELLKDILKVLENDK